MLSEVTAAVASLAASGEAIRALASDLSPESARWKPAPDRWSILEVVNHLADEESEDFRARLDLLLHRPAEAFAPIDPQGWVVSRDYSGRDLEESVARFARERRKSLDWLRGLDSPALDHTRRHPSAGVLSGRQMLASWVAHDLLHVRQITRLRYQHLAATHGFEAIAYAGDW